MAASICTRRKYQTPRKLTLVEGGCLKNGITISGSRRVLLYHSSSLIFELSLPARFQHLYWKIRQQFVFQINFIVGLTIFININTNQNSFLQPSPKSMKFESSEAIWFYFLMQAKNFNSFYFLLYDWYVDKYTYLQSKFLCIHISWEKEIIA